MFKCEDGIRTKRMRLHVVAQRGEIEEERQRERQRKNRDYNI